MSPKKVEVGMRFKLGAWEWKVEKIIENAFLAGVMGEEYRRPNGTFKSEDAAKLDWLPEPVTFTEAQRDAIKNWRDADKVTVWHKDFMSWLDANTVGGGGGFSRAYEGKEEPCCQCSRIPSKCKPGENCLCSCFCHKQ